VNYIIGTATSDLAVRYHGPKTRPPKRLRAWSEVFIQWHAVHRRYALLEGDDDIGWRWGERPSVSFLTAAIWAAGGAGLQEYKIDRKVEVASQETKKGRADLFASIAGGQYKFEAKHDYVRIDTKRTESTFTRKLAQADNAVRRIDEGYHWEGALGFFSLQTKGLTRKQTASKVREFRETDFNAVANDAFEHFFQVDLFPTWMSPKRIEQETRRFPGMTFFLGLRESE